MWYYAEGEEKRGTFTEEQMKELLSQAKINGNTPVWRKGLEQWQQLKKTELSKYITKEMPDLPNTSDAAENAKIATQAALSKAKEATGHAITAIKIIITDPMGGQGKAWQLLGEDRGMLAGLACITSYCLVPLLYLYLNGFSREPVKTQLIFILFVALTPALIAFSSFITSMIFVKNSSIKGVTFSTGIAMLPILVNMVAAGILGIGNIEIVIVISIFSLTSFCLLLNAGLIQVHNLSTRVAFWCTPLIITILLYGCKIFIARSYGIVVEDAFGNMLY